MRGLTFYSHVEKHLHHFTEREIWVYKTVLTPPFFFIEVFVQSQESDRSCICVSGVSILPLSVILILKFGTAFYFII